MNRCTYFDLILPVILSIGLVSFWGLSDERDRWQQPDKIMDSLDIRQGMVIGEVGAGEGYFTFKLAQRVGSSGHIYANDIVNRYLDHINAYCRQQKIDNVTTILGKIDDPLFPSSQLDLVVMMRVFHDLSQPVNLVNNIIPALKPGAPLVIIDPESNKVPDNRTHFYSKDKILAIMQKSKFKLIKTLDFLPQDIIYIYRYQE
jgi:ubiquinone/menaquinone biosynthesis C-methylase UbiE